ncbi:papilin-like [Mytilus trossulus]|uniref:papilin-like n=1 Tax=Mytilus trossulus TaxID=6551 RepID=UPI003004E079
MTGITISRFAGLHNLEQIYEVCNLPQFGGPGVEAIQRWFYNDRMMQCESFMYGGLNGNMNNFRTKTECEGLCNGVKSFPCGRLPECGTPQRNRYMHCYEHTRSIKNGVFCSTGCGTERRCKKGFCPKDPQVTCASKCISDRDCNGKRLCCSKCCRDPEDRKPGKCSNDSSQLTVHRTCYLRKSECERDSQCVGNRKCCRFSCGNICVDPDYAEFRDNQLHILMLPRNHMMYTESLVIFLFLVLVSLIVAKLYLHHFNHKTAEAQQSDNICDLPKVAGPCNARIKRFYYDVNSGSCGKFYYGGCDGNENNFKTIEECKTVCNKRVCTLPQVGGPGGVAIQRWLYNSDTMKCESFTYGGSNGNKNNFKTKTECEGLCNGVKKDPCGQRPSCPPPPMDSCFGFTYNIINGVKCITGCNYACSEYVILRYIICTFRMHIHDIGRPLVFLIYITLQISDAQLVDNVCDLKKDVGQCNARMSRYHYDVDSGECKQFFYGGCDGNENNFKTKQECFTDCEKRVCTLVVNYGFGGAKIKRWFYNSETMKCETFKYGGSYGNKNSFRTRRSCKKLCKGVKRDPCGHIPPCLPPRPNECGEFTFDVINGVECIIGCRNSRCKQGSCPTNPSPGCTSNCALDIECAGNKLCCSGCCRVPTLDNKPGTCPTDPGQQQCYGKTSECEKDSQCDGKRKCCKFSCMNFCVDPEE